MLTLEQARKAVRITSHDFDDELDGLILAGIEDLSTAGIATMPESSLYDSAIRMYVIAHWEPDAPEAQRAAEIFDGLKTQMHLHSKYRKVEEDEA